MLEAFGGFDDEVFGVFGICEGSQLPEEIQESLDRRLLGKLGLGEFRSTLEEDLYMSSPGRGHHF